jgi:hypothetical protein
MPGKSNWHRAWQTAHEAAGWLVEHPVRLGGQTFRLDAFTEREGVPLVREFAHTWDKGYPAKHAALTEAGYSVAWLYEGVGEFCYEFPDRRIHLRRRVTRVDRLCAIHIPGRGEIRFPLTESDMTHDSARGRDPWVAGPLTLAYLVPWPVNEAESLGAAG